MRPNRVDCDAHTTVQNQNLQKAASAYFTSKQILSFGFAERHMSNSSMGQIPHVRFPAICMGPNSGPTLAQCWPSAG